MKNILRPAINLMNRLSYAAKFLCIGFLLLFVVALLTYQLCSLALSNADFSHKELYGNAYIEKLLPIYIDSLKFRNLQMDYLSGNTAVRDQMLNLQNNIDSVLNEMTITDQQLNKELDSTSQFNLIKNKWDKIKDSKFQGSIQDQLLLGMSFTQDLVTQIVNVADTSNLTLDPDIDTYYFMDITTTKLPAFIKQIADIRDLSQHNLTQSSPENESKFIIARSAVLDVYLPVINSDLKKIKNYNNASGASFIPKIDKINTETANFINLANQLITAKSTDPNLNKEVNSKGNALLNDSFNFFAMSLAENDKLIKLRVDNQMNKLYLNLALSGISTLVLFYLLLGIYFSIKESIRSLTFVSDALMQGDLETKVYLETKDEMNKIADSFNNMQFKLSNFIKETQFVVSSAIGGDLSKRLKLKTKSGYSKQLAELLNKLMMLIQNLVDEINHSIKTINSATKEITSGSIDLAKRTENQAASLQQTSASLEELTSTVKQNAESAKQANDVAHSATDLAIKGGESVKHVVDTMTTINASSKKIVDIISVIDGIAFQTNILALNAAVEAARAGEQGRGFAVVANEVRNLAQRSAIAAKEIKELIVDSVDKIDTGSKQVDLAGAKMNELVLAIQNVAGFMTEITSASMQQSSGIEQVNQAVAKLDEITQKNALMASKAASTAQILGEQTEHMNDIISAYIATEKENNIKEETRKNVIPPTTDLSLDELSPLYSKEEKEKKNKRHPELQQTEEEWTEF